MAGSVVSVVSAGAATTADDRYGRKADVPDIKKELAEPPMLAQLFSEQPAAGHRPFLLLGSPEDLFWPG